MGKSYRQEHRYIVSEHDQRRRKDKSNEKLLKTILLKYFNAIKFRFQKTFKRRNFRQTKAVYTGIAKQIRRGLSFFDDRRCKKYFERLCTLRILIILTVLFPFRMKMFDRIFGSAIDWGVFILIIKQAIYLVKNGRFFNSSKPDIIITIMIMFRIRIF